MTKMRLALPLALAPALICGAMALPAQAAEPVQTFLPGLGGALHVSFSGGSLYVADTFSGRVLRANPSTRRTSVVARNIGAAAVSVGENGRVFAAIGEGGGAVPSLVRIAAGKPVLVADLLAAEKKNNPDGQPFTKDDALSNPYDVLAQPNRTLVADAAANAVLSVAKNGSVRTLVVLPVSKAGACATRPNNGVANGGCDPVPTAMAVGPDGYLYVSGLGGEVEGHVWKVEQSSGRIAAEYRGLPPLTGIAVGAAGNIYVSSLFANRVFRLSPAGTVTGSLKVTGPTGLAVLGGQVYAGSLVLSGTAPPKGSVVRFSVDAFDADSAG